MEIKITDFISLRAFAMQLATQTMIAILQVSKKYDIEDHLQMANDIAVWIKGKAQLPEFTDTNKLSEQWVKMLSDRQNESNLNIKQ